MNGLTFQSILIITLLSLFLYSCSDNTAQIPENGKYEVLSKTEDEDGGIHIAVFAEGTNWSSMEDFVKSTKGLQSVYFFYDKDNAPDLSVMGHRFPQKYDKYIKAIFNAREEEVDGVIGDLLIYYEGYSDYRPVKR